MNPPQNCLECGTALQTADVGGLCPKCLLRLGLASQLASGTLPATAAGLTPNGTVAEPFDFGGYRILRLLGKGGMGAVYEAEQRATGRVVALKVLGQTLDTPEMRQRFLREGQLAAAVRHPNSVAVLSAEEIDGAPVIAMELVPEGTLRDRVKRSGPLPIAEAVDAVLQIIDGLEAAHAGGVLHRDVKPANCFFTSDGSVKVGDFGLSISTLVKAEQQLTQTGTVLGTPAFASPEQLRAQEIDVRSDIYSVGATLYFLLTGKPTHDAEALVALIAAVLERDPVDPKVLRPELPDALARVIMRCLARNPAGRFSSYAELRSALLPFRSAALRPAPLGLRFFAGMIDALVISLPWMVILSGSNLDPETNFLINRTAASFIPFALVALWEIAFVTLPEGRWGAGLGKALCGLRVVKQNGDVPGLFRSLGRWSVLTAAAQFHVLLVLLSKTAEEARASWLESGAFWQEVIPPVLLVLLFVTMRRRNGFAAVHDLVTRTRVVVSPTPVEGQSQPVAARPLPMEGAARLGAYRVVQRHNDELVLGYDEALRRHVWIQMLPVGTPPIDTARRDLGRAGRLRWLAGMRSDQENWDAYEAPAGTPLSGFLDQRQPWALVRSWLYDLSEELRIGLDTHTVPPEIGADRLWLAGDGRVVILDFEAPGADIAATRKIGDERDAQRFVSEIAVAATAPRIPLHASEFLRTLGAGKFESIALVAGNLCASMERPAAVSFRRRLITVAVPVVLALLCAVLSLRGDSKERVEFQRAWAGSFSGLESPWELVAIHEDSQSHIVRAQILTILAARYPHTLEVADFWNRAKERGYTAGRIRMLIESATEELPKASEADAAAAEEKLKPVVKSYRDRAEYTTFELSASVIIVFQVTLGFLGMVWVVFTGVPPLLRLNYIAIVRKDGRVASRVRVLWRMFVTWLPLVIGLIAIALVDESSHRDLMRAFVIMAGVLAVAAFGAVWAVMHPDRGLQDRLAGTWLVPR